MDLAQSIEVTCEVARRQSFAGAARALNLSAPSVSRIVGDFENHLGVRLFNRSTRNVALTEEGAQLVARGRSILDELDVLREEAAMSTGEPSGLLRVTSVVAFGTHLLTPAVAEFRARYPRIEIELDLSNRRVDMIEEHIDVALRIGGQSLPDSAMVARRVFAQHLIFVATPGFVERNGVPLSLDELKTLPSVRFISGRFGQSHVLTDGHGQQIDYAQAGDMRVNSPIAAKNAILGGDVCGLIADYLVCEELRIGVLTRLLPALRTRPQPIFAVYPERL